ncbi:hypothetical protein ABZ153_07825 [Streptomyces sp. NPDC006290]|jgi:hypothetical protein|uniref:hypothetical protein n=1 Tax=Streptomyces sp. NPDC006290 TaxID=3156745 RepID=UPI0033B9A04F
MDAERAAERVLRALERRRTRLVLTPAARAASVAHGVAPVTVTRLSGFAARLLPHAQQPGRPGALRAIRSWLTPAITLNRWWQAWTGTDSPSELQALSSERCLFTGRRRERAAAWLVPL